jgi:hypothetical protein
MNRKAFIVILQSVSLIILFYFLGNFFFKVDLAETKNNHLAASEKYSIEKMQSIDSVKIKAKQLVNRNRENFIRESKQAIKGFWLIFLLIVLQIGIVILRIKKWERAES